MEILILYDNRTAREDLRAGWGFSALVDLSAKKFLFDTGADGEALLANMERLDVNPKEIDAVLLSHPHRDHTGGLMDLLHINPHIEVYLGMSFPNKFKQAVEQVGASLFEVSGPKKLFEGVYTTGEQGRILKEQSVIIEKEQGVLVITGCAHPGVVTIAKNAKKELDKPIDLLLGGFHLIGAPRFMVNGIINSLKKLGVKKVAPCHCTGDEAIALFAKAYKDRFISVGTGTRISF